MKTTKTRTVWAGFCPVWETVVSLYETKELAEVAASVMNSEAEPASQYRVNELSVFGGDQEDVSEQVERDI